LAVTAVWSTRDKESFVRKKLQGQIERLKAAGATYVDARWYPVEEAEHLVM